MGRIYIHNYIGLYTNSDLTFDYGRYKRRSVSSSRSPAIEGNDRDGVRSGSPQACDCDAHGKGTRCFEHRREHHGHGVSANLSIGQLIVLHWISGVRVSCWRLQAVIKMSCFQFQQV